MINFTLRLYGLSSKRPSIHFRRPKVLKLSDEGKLSYERKWSTNIKNKPCRWKNHHCTLSFLHLFIIFQSIRLFILISTSYEWRKKNHDTFTFSFDIQDVSWAWVMENASRTVAWCNAITENFQFNAFPWNAIPILHVLPRAWPMFQELLTKCTQ